MPNGKSEEEAAWQDEAPTMVLEALGIAKGIVSLRVEFGEGAKLQKLTHGLRSMLRSPDYMQFAVQSRLMANHAAEYANAAASLHARVKEDWSLQGKRQAERFLSISQHLVEMADSTVVVADHKAGLDPLSPMDLDGARRQFSRSHDALMELFYAATDRLFP